MAHQAGPGVVTVPNETNNTLTRITKGGKHLRYELRIIQQPQRARACGAGAKASADRRPVDPPPIIQLQIFEILPNGEAHDVTFTTNATYFLFATLERGRAIAPARNVHDNKNVDVLTGTNVTGMQPFDRPTPAIYFIFPDLSVRHEGKYRLNFSLFEDTRRPEDEDRNDVSSSPNEHLITHRLDVRSTIFDVFSAKRFPGLTESTSLSRTFAEQGSRIRIRRDIRMRRRDTKGAKDWEDYDDDNNNNSNSAQHPRMSHTPDFSARGRQSLESMQRPQSSNGQGHHMQHGPARRTSMNDFNQQYQVPQPSSNFAFPNTYSPATAPQAYTPASTLHAPGLSESYGSASNMSSAPQQQQHNYFGYGQQGMSQMQYPPLSTNFDSTYQQRSSSDFSANSADSRRASVQSLMPQNQQMYTPQATHNQNTYSNYARQPQLMPHHPAPSQPQHSTTHAPPEPIQPPTRVTTPNPPTLSAKPSFGTTLPPLSTSFPHKLEATSPSSAAPSSSFVTSTLPTPTDTHKRSYGSTFPTSWQNNASKQGARPEVVSSSSMFLAADADGDDTTDLGDEGYLRVYRRAGGRHVQRQMP